jgi:hypothetical protein
MNDDITPEAPKFDLFATEVEDNLKEELAKGTFQWTNKYTKGLGVLLIVTGLLSGGAWYGHYEATKSSSVSGISSFASLRAAFGGGGFGGGTGTGTGTAAAAAAAGGFGGFGGGTRITGTIKSVKGSTVTITLDDPTQASSLAAGDAARVTDTSGTTAGGGGTAASGGTAAAGGGGAGAPAPVTSKASSAAGTSTTGTTRTPGTTGGTGRGGGAFSNPKLTACLTKAGITLTAGARPNFQDPATAAALQACFAQLGITPGGGFGGGGAAGGAAPAPAATK